MAEACRVLDAPVIGGNVSLYNENAKGAIYPTPVVGMVGLVHDVDHITTQGFKKEGDVILLLGNTKAELGGSEFQSAVHGVTEGRPPELDLTVERTLLDTVLAAIQQGLVQSAHDLSEGGLAVALAESCISGGIGAQVNIDTELRHDVALFSESQSRILLSATPDKAAELEKFISERSVPVNVIGRVEGTSLVIDINRASALNKSVEGLKQVWEEAIPCLMK
ncbi:Phosphoribosylformylglycinamidine synthase 2 [compost metagenome]